MTQDIEYKSISEIEAFQNERLKEAIAYLQTHSPFYQRMFKEYGINPSEIKTIKDLQKIPFTEKKDLQLHNSEFLCVAPEKIVDYITT